MSTDQTPAAMPTNDEVFRSAMEPPAPPPPAEPPAPAPATDERPRGPDGRFIAADEQTPEAPAAATAPPSAPPAPDEDETAQLPSWRAREIREERDAMRAKFEAEATARRQAEQIAMEQARHLQALQARLEQPPQAPEPPDMIADPQGYHRYITEQHQQSLRNLEANFSFRIAHDRHGETFEAAWNTMMGRAQRGDPSIVQQVMRSPDPGMAMVNWYRRESTLATVGDDPMTWAKQTIIEQIKKDPKLAGEIAEMIRGGAPATNGQGAPNVQLPPSLNRMPASAPASPGVNGMPSNEEMFRYAFREGR